MSTTLWLYCFAGVCAAVVLRAWLLKSKFPENAPPIVDISTEEIFFDTQRAYEDALAKHGPVIGVRRKGRLEYIVDDTLTSHILTTENDFSFEKGTATILNLHYFAACYPSFFRDLDDVVQKGISPRIHSLVEHLFPTFVRRADDLLGARSDGPVDMFDHAQRSIGEAMVIFILGKKYLSDRNLDLVLRTADDMATFTGIYQNTSWFGRTFPMTWKIYTGLRVVFLSIICGFFWAMLPQIWRDLRSRKWFDDGTSKDYRGDDVDTVLAYLAKRHANSTGTVSFGAAVRIVILITGLIFASIHQTASVAVWVVFELAKQPRYQDALRKELLEHMDPQSVDPDFVGASRALNEAIWLDSFIREVMRTKGDTLGICRETLRDVALAGYTIPKGHLMFPLSTLSNQSVAYHGPDAKAQRPERWHVEGNMKPANMVGISHLAFGLGRWACPGRILAVAEIKMIVWALLAKTAPRLSGDSYKIVDVLNTTSVPPEGELFLDPYPSKQAACKPE